MRSSGIPFPQMVTMIVGFAPQILILFGCIEYLINTRSGPAILMLAGTALGLLLRVFLIAFPLALVSSGAPRMPVQVIAGISQFSYILTGLVFAAGFLWMALRSAKRVE